MYILNVHFLFYCRCC